MTDGPVVGFQRWDSLLFLHWALPVSDVRAHVPEELEIDTFEGLAYVSVTPFTLKGGRLRFLPAVPGLSSFHETNARTYVRRNGERGIWFFSLDATSAAASALARVSLQLPYFPARISRSQVRTRFDYRVDRAWPRPVKGLFKARWDVRSNASVAQPGSLEHFLVERYVLFSRGLGGRFWDVGVRHRPWDLHDVENLSVEQRLDETIGLPPLRAPVMAHWSPGVDVEIFAPHLSRVEHAGVPRTATGLR